MSADAAARATQVVADLATHRGQDLITFAFLLTGDSDAADDLVQSVFAKLLASTSIADATNPYAYAKRAVTNELLDRRRRLVRWSKALVLMRSDPIATEPPEASAAERDALRRTFAVLSPRERVCIVLRYYEDWDDASIAATLGCASGTVRSLASRALARLRTALAETNLHDDHKEGGRQR